MNDLAYTASGDLDFGVRLSPLAEGGVVRATVADELRVLPALAGLDLYDLSVRRVNISGSTVLDWRVSVGTAPTGSDPATHADLTYYKARLRWDGRAQEQEAENRRLAGSRS